MFPKPSITLKQLFWGGLLCTIPAIFWVYVIPSQVASTSTAWMQFSLAIVFFWITSVFIIAGSPFVIVKSHLLLVVWRMSLLMFAIGLALSGMWAISGGCAALSLIPYGMGEIEPERSWWDRYLVSIPMPFAGFCAAFLLIRGNPAPFQLLVLATAGVCVILHYGISNPDFPDGEKVEI